MADVRGLSLLLALWLPVVSASEAGTVIRINKAILNYVSEFGKVPFQEALKINDEHFLDQSSDVLPSVRIQVLEAHVSRLGLKFLPDFGVRLWASANFTVKVSCIPESLELSLPVKLLSDLRVTQSSIGTPKISISTFFPYFGQATVLDDNKNLSPALLSMVQKDIKAIFSNKLSLNVANLVDDININMGTIIGLNNLSPESQICYYVMSEPNITSDSISMNLNAVLFLLGKPVMLPQEGPHLELPEPESNKDAMATLTLSQNLFDAILMLLQKAGAFNMDITGQLKSEDNPLNTSALSQFIPEMADQFPEPKPVVLRVRMTVTPVAVFQNNSITVRLQPLVEVLATSSNSAFQSLFSLNVVVNLSLQLSVSRAKLYATTSVVGDVFLVVASSNVGSVNLDHMQTLMNTVFQKSLLDHINALLGNGISLPTMVNLHYVNTNIQIREHYVQISSGLSYHP
uniref:BPI fold containing family B member 2 n=1 Tax=Sciurus vulgaris TaxID=55149 RepID=A0A8D2AQQ2_SCIVU